MHAGDEAPPAGVHDADDAVRPTSTTGAQSAMLHREHGPGGRCDRRVGLEPGVLRRARRPRTTVGAVHLVQPGPGQVDHGMSARVEVAGGEVIARSPSATEVGDDVGGTSAGSLEDEP